MSATTPGGETETAPVGTEDIAELLSAFQRSEWKGLRLRIGGVTVSAGKDAAPPEPSVAAPAAVVESPQALAAPQLEPERSSPSSVPAPAAAPAAVTPMAAIDETGLTPVASPTVGTFWAAPDPGSPPFVEVGARVAAGDQLGIVEVMKLMNPVVTEVAGEVVAIRASNAELVEFGQPLFLIRPDE